MTRALAVLACLGSLALAGAAGAHRPASRHERAVILRAVGRLHLGRAYPRSSYRLRVDVSSVRQGRWALVVLLPSRGHERQVQGDAVSLQKVNGRWRIHGTASGVGCRVPRDVRRDLRLDCV